VQTVVESSSAKFSPVSNRRFFSVPEKFKYHFLKTFNYGVLYIIIALKIVNGIK